MPIKPATLEDSIGKDRRRYRRPHRHLRTLFYNDGALFSQISGALGQWFADRIIEDMQRYHRSRAPLGTRPDYNQHSMLPDKPQTISTGRREEGRLSHFVGVNTLRTSYLLLTLVAVVCFAVYVLFPSAPEGWRGFSLNLLTEVLGIIFTIVLIDRVLRRREERERMRYCRIALQQLRFPLMEHLEVLFNMYKASVQRKPERRISSLEDLFEDDYFEQVSHLDLSKPAPVAPQMQWGDYLLHETQRFKDALERVVGRYAVPLGPDTVDIAEQLIASRLISMLERFPAMRASRPAQFRGWPEPMLYGMGGLVRQYTDAFAALVDIYNDEAPEDQRVAITKKNLWKENVSPRIGSARIQIRSVSAEQTASDANSSADD